MSLVYLSVFPKTKPGAVSLFRSKTHHPPAEYTGIH